jgi:hypothetical protein
MSSSGFSKAVLGNAPWVLASALVGAIAFVTVQKLAGFPMNIAQFMGREIVRQGGYSPGLAGLVGWFVHLGVAASYATLYAAIVLAPFFPTDRAARWGAALGVALVLGWLTTLVTAPAIAITIGLLSGQGFPASLPSLNATFGSVFWNHVGFFLISFGITVVARDTFRAR